jgi:hypothetical protein
MLDGRVDVVPPKWVGDRDYAASLPLWQERCSCGLCAQLGCLLCCCDGCAWVRSMCTRLGFFGVAPKHICLPASYFGAPPTACNRAPY